MRQAFAAILFFLAATPLASAQGGAPRLDEPLFWEIHGPDGKLPYTIQVEWLGEIGGEELWALDIYMNGNVVTVSYALVDPWDLSVIDVFNGDSHNWVEWVWEEDHYKKVGGTANVRTFHPVY